MGKENLYDHSVRVPLLIRVPEMEPGRRNGLCCGFDVFPTLCDLAGADAPSGLDGCSVRPQIEGGSSASGGREAVFGAFIEAQRSVRTERWKLIHYPQIGRWQLFDLERDPRECCGLAQAWRYLPWSYKKDKYFEPSLDRGVMEKVVRELHRRLVAWQHEVGEPVAEPVVA